VSLHAWRALRWLSLWLALGRLGIALAIVLSLVPLPDAGIEIEQGDKYGHALVWFLLTAWYGQLCAPRRALALRALAFVALGGAIELAQGLTSFRSCDWRDFLADVLGVAAGYALSRTRAANVLAWLEGRITRA
jgi:VanZ family protein